MDNNIVLKSYKHCQVAGWNEQDLLCKETYSMNVMYAGMRGEMEKVHQRKLV